MDFRSASAYEQIMINRRDALKRLGGLAGLAALPSATSGCGEDAGQAGITNYVYLMLENRTYDHVLGARSMLEGKPGNGLTAGTSNPDVNGNPVAIYEPSSAIEEICVAADPPHGWTTSRQQWNGGANDGFVRIHQEEHGGAPLRDPMQYLTRTQIPITWALADAYTTCDQWFASLMGPTLPNRFYWHAATSCGYRSNSVINAVGSLSTPTIYHRLRDRNIEWAYYYGSLPVVSALANFAPPYNLPTDYVTPRVRRFGDAEVGAGQFFKDAADGTLPPVTYIDPFFYLNDDHPPAHPIMAQALIASIYTALANSPQWKNILFVITYDEHGGFYDHVSPPKTTDDTLERWGVDENGDPATGFEQLGFRVPALVIGPYVKRGYVSSVQYDHTSALKQLANAFDLESLTPRMSAANDLTDCIDMERLAAGDPADPIELPALDLSAWPRDGRCEGTGFGARFLDPISEAADRDPTLFAGYDLRDDHELYLASIEDFLRTHQCR